MKHKNLLKFALLFVFAMITNLNFGQTTVSYDFSSGSAVSGLNEASPGIALDSNIGFGSFKNSGTSNPGVFSNQLRLYQNATKGGSIIIYANNGVTITNIVVNASSRTGNAGYTVDGGSQVDLTGGSTYTISGISSTSQVEFFQRDASSSNRIYIDSFSVTYTTGGSNPTVSFDSATSSETETDATFATSGIPITLTNYDADVTITATVNGSSTAESGDYTLDLTPLTFDANETLVLPLSINDDADFDDETIVIDFTVTSGTADLGTSTHTVTITDNETPPSIGFDATTSTETETDATFTSANIPITVSDYSGEQIDINVAITGGTAESGDYTYTTQSLSFTANETQNITVDINDDADSDDETIILTITETSSVTGLTISEATHTITITDNEGPSSIYSEDFTGQNGKGAVGPTPTIDVTGVDWTVDVSGATLSASSDFFQVVNEIFQGQDLDGDAIWMSPSIDISSFTNVQFSLSAVESGTMESGDIFVTEYRINGGTWTQAATNGSLNDDFTSETVSQTGLNGSTLEIRVTMNNGAGSEIHRLDDILVEGTPASSDPTVTFDAASSSQTETDATFATAGIPITLTNYDADVTVTATVNGSSTAESGDYVIDLTPLVFNANETLSIPLSINPDADFNDETIIIDITVTNGTADVNVSQHTVTITDDDIPNIYISEIMYNTPSTDDEWIELYNGSGSDIDVSNWTLEYTGGTFTFPSSTTFTNGAYVVIAVGSNGDGSFNNDNPFTPDYTSIAGGIVADVATTNTSNQMRNDTDSVTLKNAGGSTVDIVTYNDDDGSSTDGLGDTFELVDTSADNSATSSNWQVSAFSGGTPKAVNASYWTGNTDSDWNTASNWTAVGIPGTTSNVVIPNGLTNYPTASSAVTINQGIIESGATLIAQSTFTGNVTYQRELTLVSGNANGWHLVASPVAGVTFDVAWAQSNSIAVSTNDANRLAIGQYNTSGNNWSYLTSPAGSFDGSPGNAFTMKRSFAGAVSFTGTINTSDVTVTGISNAGSDKFNLIGNPYTSFVSSQTFLNAHTDKLAPAIWTWTHGVGYTVRTSEAQNFSIPPAQGFFVQAITADDVIFASSNQSSGTQTFQKVSRGDIDLTITDSELTRMAHLFYFDNGKVTTGYDYGYEGELFGGAKHKLAIYLELLTDNQGKKYQVQSLPTSKMEGNVVPLGIIAQAGKQITISAEVANLPSGIKVFLEDKLTNTFTRLDEVNSNYKITLTESLDGIGRFYLHTKANVLSINDINLNNVSIYKTNNSNLRIVGLSQGKASIKLFNLLGKEVLNSSFTSNGVQDISLPNLSKGIYIVQLETESGKLNKKITLE